MAKATVLIVMHDQVTAKVVKKALETYNYAVNTATTLDGALAQMRSVTPDVIIAGCFDPGYELFQQARTESQWQAIPFIFIVSTLGEYDDLKLVIDPTDAIILGAFNMDEVLGLIEAALSPREKFPGTLLLQTKSDKQVVLILAESAELLNGMQRILTVNGYAVLTAKHVDQALEAMLSPGQAIPAIIIAQTDDLAGEIAGKIEGIPVVSVPPEVFGAVGRQHSSWKPSANAILAGELLDLVEVGIANTPEIPITPPQAPPMPSPAPSIGQLLEETSDEEARIIADAIANGGILVDGPDGTLTILVPEEALSEEALPREASSKEDCEEEAAKEKKKADDTSAPPPSVAPPRAPAPAFPFPDDDDDGTIDLDLFSESARTDVIPVPGESSASGEPEPADVTFDDVEGELEGTAPEPEPIAEDDVQFSAYYPREVQAETRYGLYVYAHLETLKEMVQKDVQKFKEELGGTIEKPKVAKQTPKLKRGAPVTVVPECDEINFEPASITKTWQGDWTRYGFDFRPDKTLIDEPVIIRVSVQVHHIEIAQIKCAVEVVEKTANAPMTILPENPLAAAQLTVENATIYQKIFVSYSRDDKEVVEAYRLAQLARGDDVFMDTYSIRSGEAWQAALANAIKSADIFQLFWSESSEGSKYVRYEWEYALTYRCPDNQCVAFIRPVYWDKPLISPPPELGHLNFRYVPLDEPDE